MPFTEVRMLSPRYSFNLAALFMLMMMMMTMLVQVSVSFGVPKRSFDFAIDKMGPGGRIINGTEATTEDTKHQVSVRRKLYDSYYFGTGHICGGSLIASNVVLSAAHCFVDYSLQLVNSTFLPDEDFIVVMGNLDRFERNNNTLVYGVKKIVYFVDGIFNLGTYENDIALLFLNDSVPENHLSVAPIAINRETPENGTVCQVTGWGNTEQGYLSDLLMTVDLPLLDYDTCANDTDFAGEGLILKDMICAGYLGVGERDACNGDSGGPMVCNNQQTGIVSWGVGCAEPLLPGVYANVAYFASWIDEQIGLMSTYPAFL